MALENIFSWTTLASMLDEMTPTLSKSKLLVRVLLEELQKLQKKGQPNEKFQYRTDEIETSNVQDIETNYVTIINEDPDQDREIAENELLEYQKPDNIQEDQEIQYDESCDLNNFYTFVENDETKIDGSMDEANQKSHVDDG